MRKLCFALLSLAFFSACLSAQTQTRPAPALHNRGALSEYGKLPLSFEANRGQTDGQVRFLSRGSGFSLFLTNDEAVIDLMRTGPSHIDPRRRFAKPTRMPDTDGSTASVKLHMQVLGANLASRVVGAAELPGKANYFIGNDPAKWRTNVPTYAQVKYESVYPGVDLIYYGNRGRLEYDFVVAPGIDPGLIALRFRGGSDVAVNQNGDLLLNSEDVRFQKPEVYQDTDGTRKLVESQYVMTANNTIRFAVGDYDRSKPLVIDPVLVYSTFLGGSDVDDGRGIAVDASGNAYVIGDTSSSDFPTANAIQPTFTGFHHTAFVTKINASGSALVYSTYLGGSLPNSGGFLRDSPGGIAVDASGNAYVTGFTTSPDFPTTVNAIQPTSPICPGSTCDPNAAAGFVTKINASGSALVYSTYLGGSFADGGNSIAVDRHGNAYVTGFANSSDFPTVNALQSTLGSGAQANAFVSKINASGSALVYSTYLGGGGPDNFDVGTGIAVDASGNAYVTGWTRSSSFPTANALQPTLKGLIQNAFVTKINANGSAFVYSTYLGGRNISDDTPKDPGDQGNGIAVDSSGNAYVAGQTSSADFATANPLQSSLVGPTDAFLTKINASGSALVYSTFLGGSGDDRADSVAVDGVGNAYIAGTTFSTNFPAVSAVQSTFGGGSSDSFVAEINPGGSALVYSTDLGGSGDEFSGGIALDSLGNVYLTGFTRSPNFPTANPLQHTLRGDPSNGDAFATKIASTIAARLNLSGVELLAGHPCPIGGENGTCGVHSVGWSGGSGHVPNGWVALPGDGRALWEAAIGFQGDVAFGKTINLLKGGRLELLLKKNKLLSEMVTEGTVVWPPSVMRDLGCGEGVAKVTAFFKTKQDAPASFVGCLHDLPAGSVIPPKIWGTFFTLKSEIDEDHESPE
jgi:hypothetical protein